MRSRKFLFVLVLGALFLITDQCDARGGLFSRFGRRSTPGVTTPDSGSCEKPHRAVARIAVTSLKTGKRILGTAILIGPGGKRDVAITAHHLFTGITRPFKITLTFPNGKKFEATLVAEDKAADLAAVVMVSTGIEPMPLSLVAPLVGDRVSVAGYGGEGCYRTTFGVVEPYSRDRDPVVMAMSGGSRGGDSGGPMVNASGELVGVLATTNGRSSYGAYNGEICQFLSGDFELPWKRDRGEDEGDSDVENIPLPVDPVVDDEARQMLQDVLSRITELDRAASDAAGRAAEREAILAAGQQVIQDGLTDETIDAASAAAQPVLVRWLGEFGVDTFVATVLAIILLVVIVRWLKTNTADVRSGKTKSVFAQAAARTTWKGDDAVARQIDKRLYGIGVLKETQADAEAESSPPPPTKPPAADPVASVESRIAAAEARVAELEEKGK